MDATHKVRFKATPERKEWTHAKGGAVREPYGEGTTIRIRAPIVLRDGEATEMTTFEKDWCLAHYPENFEVVDPADLPPRAAGGKFTKKTGDA